MSDASERAFLEQHRDDFRSENLYQLAHANFLIRAIEFIEKKVENYNDFILYYKNGQLTSKFDEKYRDEFFIELHEYVTNETFSEIIKPYFTPVKVF